MPTVTSATRRSPPSSRRWKEQASASVGTRSRATAVKARSRSKKPHNSLLASESRRCSVMSVLLPNQRTILPFSSRIGIARERNQR